MTKKEILFISPFVPYDKVPHAGGKIHTYYLKQFQSDDEFNIKLISIAEENEIQKVDLDQYNINYDIAIKKMDFIERAKRGLLNFSSKFNPYDKTGGMVSGYIKKTIINKIKKLSNLGYIPDIIILEWTEVALLVTEVKKIFPNAKTVLIEHDVTFLGYQRKYQIEESKVKRYVKKVKFKNEYDSELKSLLEGDLVLTFNYKDRDILVSNGISKNKVHVIPPFFMNLNMVHKKNNSKQLLFFGAMSRVENYDSCIWFIENVFNKLLSIDKEFTFVICGGNPNKKLLKYASENIIITGYVDSVEEYFRNSMCLVAPLLLGAGIKIKILEGLSSGIPVLTNEIGIEGIPAQDGKEYIHCQTPEDYINAIIKIRDEEINTELIRNNALLLMDEKFNLSNGYDKYKAILNSII